MIELIILNYLKAHGIDAHLEMPKNLPSFPFVIVEKTGSAYSNRLTTSMLAIQSYAASMYETIQLNETVKQIMNDAVELSEITHVSLNGDYNFTDTNTKRYRYQAVFDITHY